MKATKMRFGLLYPTTFESVNEISKRDKTKLISTGITAENRLGSSIQFPKNTCFLTSGSGRKLKLGNRMVTLLHGAPQNFAFNGRLMQEMVLALHSIGQNNITVEVEARIGQLLAEQQDNDTIAHDLLLASVWMRKLIERNRKKQL